MSTQAAKQFLDSAVGDPALENRVATAPDRQAFVAAVVEAGREKGFTFTSDEVISVLNEQGAGELSDEQLANVAGGLSTFRKFVGKAWNALGGSGGGSLGDAGSGIRG
jgi:predicted ribosomally synthesized peptide with nif11-like leader